MKDCPLSMNEEQYSRCRRDQLADQLYGILIGLAARVTLTDNRMQVLSKLAYQLADVQIAEGKKE